MNNGLVAFYTVAFYAIICLLSLRCAKPHLLYSVSYRAHISQAAVQPFSVVEDLYVVEQISPYIFNCSIFTPVKVFLFQERKLFH